MRKDANRKRSFQWPTFLVFFAASLFFIGTIFGSIFGGVLSTRIGAKRVVNLVSPVIFAAMMLATFAPSIEYLYLTRIVTGTCYGTFLSVGT